MMIECGSFCTMYNCGFNLGTFFVLQTTQNFVKIKETKPELQHSIEL